jgi:hypothetical protein
MESRAKAGAEKAATGSEAVAALRATARKKREKKEKNY